MSHNQIVFINMLLDQFAICIYDFQIIELFEIDDNFDHNILVNDVVLEKNFSINFVFFDEKFFLNLFLIFRFLEKLFVVV